MILATLSHASKLHLKKMAEHLDFDKELLAKRGPTKLVIWTYLGYLQGCVDEAVNCMCRIRWKSQKRKSISCKGGNTSNLFSHSMISSNIIVINLKLQYIVE